MTSAACCIESTLCGYFLREYGKNFSSRVAAHAPTKYQSNSTSGRGARASYQTMLPEISARRSLLEPSFRYLSPGREGEKCRPLDHLGHIPFVHSARKLHGSNLLYIQHHSSYFLHVVRSSVLWSCIFNDCAFIHAETLLFMVQSHYKSCVFPYGTRWCILAQNT